MAKILKLTILFLFIFSNATAKDLLFGTCDYPPYYGSNLKNGGPVIEVIKMAFQKADPPHRVKVVFSTWTRALQNAKIGYSSGLLGEWYSKEREKDFIFSDPFYENVVGFYKVTNIQMPKFFLDFKSLKKYKIGVCLGYVNPEGFDEAGLQVEKVGSDLLNLRKLVFNRIDLILIDQGVAEYYLATNVKEFGSDVTGVEWVSPPLQVFKMYVTAPRSNPNSKDIIAQFNKGLKKLNEEMKVHSYIQESLLKY
jgi:polar amino acid transport system substrate-binding protein